MGRSFSFVTAAAILLVQPVLAQTSRVDELIQLARAVPPEIAADTLIKLATSRSGLSKKARLALLDEAWALADNAQERHKQQLVPGIDPASRAGWLSRAFLLDLDRLSLKSRVLIGLVRDEPVRARQMFETMAIDAPPLTCRDELAYDFEAYYQTGALIAQQAFTEAERARGDRIAFLENLIYGMRSPSQVPSIANLLLELDSRDDLAHLSGVFALMLRGVRGDDRSFSYTMRWAPSRDALERLALECKARGIQADLLVDAYRSYLIRHMSARRCGASDGGRLPGEDVVDRFNTTLRRADYASTSEIPAITSGESKPIAVETAAAVGPSSLRTTASHISATIDRALNGRQVGIRVAGRRAVMGGRSIVRINMPGVSTRVIPLTPDFYFQVTTAKDRLAVWRPSSRDDAEEYFQIKSALYESLFRVDPIGPFGDEIVSDYVNLLAQHDIERYSRVGWFLRVHDLLEAANTYGPEVVARVRDRLTFSGQPSLRAIVALRAAADRGPG